jgi:hypothetical protein
MLGAMTALVILTAAAAPAAADTFAVDRSDDADVSACTAAANDCTLRGALTKSQALGATPDTITVPAVHIMLAAPLPQVASNTVTVSGAGARSTIIDGGGTVSNAFTTNNTVLTLDDLQVTGIGPLADNSAAVAGNLDLARDAIVDNQGAGVAALTLLMDNTTVARNTGVQVGGVLAAQSAVIRNSTISDNIGAPQSGAPPIVFSPGVASAGFTVIEHSTIARNTVAPGGALLAGANLATEHLGAVTGITTVSSSVIAGGAGGATPNCGGEGIESHGNNVVSDLSCGPTASGDRAGVDPLLAPLADNGGPTDTIALLLGSPAIDAGAGCPATDERGVSRAQGTTCDAGAFESSFTAPASSPPPTATTIAAPPPPPPPPPPPADTAPPKLTIGALQHSVSAAKLRQGLSVRIAANEPVIAAVTLLVAHGHSKTPTTQLDNSALVVRSAATTKLRSPTVVVSTRRVAARVRIVAFDLAGNRSTRTVDFTVAPTPRHQHRRTATSRSAGAHGRSVS